MHHLQGLSNNPSPEPSNPVCRIDTFSLRYILILSSHLQLYLLKGFFPVVLPARILNALMPSSFLATLINLILE